jgi:peptidoglycan hydrolase-like protein with peptidoglycan-binding domain
LASALLQPTKVPMPDVGGGLSQGSSGDVVLAFERRLADLKFDPGAVDGVFDQMTRYAVEAVQKIHDLPRTGTIGEAERLAIGNFEYPAPLSSSTGSRAEVSLDRQYMVIYHDGAVRLITTVSTGSGRYFCGGDNGCQYAVTPSGRYSFNFKRTGWHKAKLGSLYNPVYFNGGIAVHGYESVPTYNASHGCVRVPMPIATYFPDIAPLGMAVYVVGTEADPTSQFSGPGPGPQGTVSAVGQV